MAKVTLGVRIVPLAMGPSWPEADAFPLLLFELADAVAWLENPEKRTTKTRAATKSQLLNLAGFKE
ncbi:MAG: hypothetical protein J0I20_07955 [Chloroflexi bacterium]|nr:hypothetical protein [Chloroflexota bacterium]